MVEQAPDLGMQARVALIQAVRILEEAVAAYAREEA